MKMAFEKIILVSGGAGFIGSHACKALAAAGFRPVVFDNLSMGHRHAVKWGPLAWVMGVFNRFANRFILRQDSAVVETHPPGETRLRAGEVLMPSDGPIIAYRRWREALRGELDPAEAFRRRRAPTAGQANENGPSDVQDEHEAPSQA